jgi:hypothetical protein
MISSLKNYIYSEFYLGNQGNQFSILYDAKFNAFSAANRYSRITHLLHMLVNEGERKRKEILGMMAHCIWAKMEQTMRWKRSCVSFLLLLLFIDGLI